MAALLSFDGLKAQILANARQYGVCPEYWDIMRSANYEELVFAGVPRLVYAYRSGIVTDAMLGEVDELLLNENGIYSTSASIVNPGVEVFVLKDAVLTIDINDAGRHNINIMGTGSATINISGNSFVTVSTWKTATANITLNDTSVLITDSRQKSVVTLAQTGTSISDLMATDDVVYNITLATGTFCYAKGFGQSAINKTGSGIIQLTLNELSTNPNPISV